LRFFGPKKVKKHVNADWVLSHLAPEELKKLKERLK